MFCQCDVPSIPEGRRRLKTNEMCLTCKNTIRKTYITSTRKRMELRIANEFHECKNGCDIEIGDLFFGMVIRGDDFERHTWALCTNCYSRRG